MLINETEKLKFKEKIVTFQSEIKTKTGVREKGKPLNVKQLYSIKGAERGQMNKSRFHDSNRLKLIGNV